MRQRALILTILLLGVVSGAFREFLFLNLNYQLDHVRRDTPLSYAHSLFQGWVSGWDYPALTRLKWVLAVVFSGIMLALSVWLARALFGHWRHLPALSLGFLAMGALAALLHLLAASVPELARVSVQLLHAIQYPVPLLFILAASLLGRR